MSAIIPVFSKPTPLKKLSTLEGKPSRANAATADTGKNNTHPMPLHEMAAQIIPTTIPQIGEHMETTTKPSDMNVSTGSIDQEGVLLKLLHKKLGSTDTEQIPTKPMDQGEQRETTNEQAPTKPVDQGELSESTNEPVDTNLDNQSMSSEALDLDESSSASVESVSATSSAIGEVVDPANLTLSDGKLDKEKMSSLSFPTANISKSLEKSFLEMKQGKEKSRLSTHKETPTHSTPAPVSTVSTRRRTSKRHTDQKARADALLLELGL